MDRGEIVNDKAYPVTPAIGGEWREDRQHTANCCVRFPACRLQAIVDEGFFVGRVSRAAA
ncbi:hypothetical protein ACFSKY_19520 [Azotobacter chroococcum]|jgi:hypothetical protein|uniref:Uncharacterized protein n=1 Tax=Azotobacter chroococcum TaxID=353 RepID=A0A4R1PVE5_9GAMM|nr:hypothetical protein [Azotobacter chroococcum]TBV99910.1 hypothetical protein E0E53_00870 [Azotobacter chroococcum]TCL31629.1 hypothetical protein EV691_11121 [Azotobacter chroococcum]